MPLDSLDFPFPVIKNLVDQMSPVDLVRVSLQSVRADNALKACGKTNVSFFNLQSSEIREIRDFEKIELFLLESERQGKLPDSSFGLYCCVSGESDVTIRCNYFKQVTMYFENLENIETFEGIRRNLKIGESLVPVVVTRFGPNEKIRLFWSNKTHGMMAFIDYFKNNFNLPIEELFFNTNDSNAIRTVVNHINSTQTVLRKVKLVNSFRFSEHDFKFILENVSATDCFSSWFEVRKTFEFNGTIRAKNIRIHNGSWFTLQHLLKSNECEEFFLDSDFKTEDLRKFLKEWESGKFPNLTKAAFHTKNTWMNYLNVTRGFERRRDKCDYSSRRRPVIAIKGEGNVYGRVTPDDSRDGFFIMRVHND